MAPLLLVRAMGEPRRAWRHSTGSRGSSRGVAIYLLFSRMGTIVFAMTTLGVWTFNPRQWRKVLVILIVALAIGAALVARSNKMSRFVVTTILKPDRDPGVEQRFGVWREALRLFRSRPITGTGLGTYDEVTYRLEGNTAEPFFRRNGWHAHNVYLHVLAETGTLGLLAWCFFWYVDHRQTAGSMETGRRAIPALRRRGAVGCPGVSRAVDQRGPDRRARARQPSHEPDHRPGGRVGAARRSGN